MCVISICLINIYSLVPLASCFFVFGLGIFVFLKNRHKKLNQLFLFFSFVVSIWLLGTFMMFNSSNDGEAIKWDRFIYLGVVFITTILYHIGIIFTNNFLNKKWSLYFAYASSIFFLFTSQSDYFVSGLYRYSWGVHTKAQILHHPFLVIFYGYFLWFFWDLIRYYKTEISAIKKEQTKYLLFGCAMLIIIGTPAYLPAYNISVFPFSFFSGMIFAVILGYTITRHYLMDIKVAVKRSIVFLILFSVLVGVFSFGSFYLISALSKFWAAFVTSVLVILGFMPLKNFLEDVTDNLFLSGKYKFDKSLADLFSVVSSTIDMRSLLDGAEKEFKRILKLNKVKISVFHFNCDYEKQSYICSHLKLHNFEILDVGFLEFFIDHGTKHERSDFLKLKKELDDFGFQIAAPIVFKDQTVGILFLGGKKENDPYYFRDINFIKTTTDYLGAAIENAKLYDKANKLIKDLSVANEAKSDFISVASHQFRTPLSTIRWYSENIINDLSSSKIDTFEIKDFAKVINNQTIFLIEVLNSIFSALEIESGKFKVEKKPYFLWETVREVIDEMKDSALYKKIDILFDKGKIFLGEVFIDSEKIKELLRILTRNALNYSPIGSKVIITVEKAVVNGKEYCRICVKDFGIGIVKKEQESVFSKFFRAQNAISFVPDGLGLGLYTAKCIVQKHNGEIWLESEPGKGSSFYVDLPLEEKQTN